MGYHNKNGKKKVARQIDGTTHLRVMPQREQPKRLGDAERLRLGYGAVEARVALPKLDRVERELRQLRGRRPL